jgi:hypothetical protein
MRLDEDRPGELCVDFVLLSRLFQVFKLGRGESQSTQKALNHSLQKRRVAPEGW